MSRRRVRRRRRERGATHSDLDENLVLLEGRKLDLLDLESLTEVALALRDETTTEARRHQLGVGVKRGGRS